MFYFKDNDRLCVYLADGSTAVWNKSNPYFEAVYQMCKESRWFEIECLHKQNQMLLNSSAHITDDGNIVIEKDGQTATIDKNNSKVTQFIELLRTKGVVDKELEHIKPFLRNMFENPYINAVTELYDYCKAMDFEITDDGCFLAYKNVNTDLSSIYDNGRTKHTIGQYTEVDTFDTDRNQTCSKGLHFCSKEYLNSYKGAVTIVVKVNPKDVVAIPTDYQYQKGRCRKYLTVGVLDKNGSLATTYDKAKFEHKTKIVHKPQVSIHGIYSVNTPSLANKILFMKHYAGYSNIKIAEILNISVNTVRKHIKRYHRMVNNEN